ncbi:hypothetical protein ABZ920_20170 [Streptomyces sp. NPDC046831]|uniref:hypothetical protein n=1 Tax=Streptomyces sp. NPDC046831 TaxID=3154805 RepID=UPI0033F952F6
MTAAGPSALLGIAAEAALAVPGTAGLQPRPVHRLAAAVAPTGRDPTPRTIPPEAGIRADRAPDGPGWHIEVRCVLTAGHRVLDTARNVHDRVRTAVTSHLAAHGGAEPVTVAVTVTAVTTHHDPP